MLADKVAATGSLAEVRDALLFGPEEWPVPVEAVEEWRDFLTTIGVRDGLWPVPVSAPAIEQDGRLYEPAAVAEHFELNHDIARAWSEDAKNSWPGYEALAHPYTPYEGRTELWCLPGQESFDRLSPSVRQLYAGLILGSIGRWHDEHFVYTFERQRPQHRSKPDTQQWPSPLRTFVERAEWFPMSDPRRRRRI